MCAIWARWELNHSRSGCKYHDESFGQKSMIAVGVRLAICSLRHIHFESWEVFLEGPKNWCEFYVFFLLYITHSESRRGVVSNLLSRRLKSFQWFDGSVCIRQGVLSIGSFRFCICWCGYCNNCHSSPLCCKNLNYINIRVAWISGSIYASLGVD